MRSVNMRRIAIHWDADEIAVGLSNSSRRNRTVAALRHLGRQIWIFPIQSAAPHKARPARLRINGADEDLDVRQVGKRIEWSALQRPMPEAIIMTVASNARTKLDIDQRIRPATMVCRP